MVLELDVSSRVMGVLNSPTSASENAGPINPLQSASQSDILSDFPIADISFLSSGDCFITSHSGPSQSLTIWSPAEDEPFEQTASLALSADPTKLRVLQQDRVVCGLSDGSLLIVQCTPSMVTTLGNVSNVHTSEVTALCECGPESRTIISGGSDGSIVSMDIETGKKNQISDFESNVRSLSSIHGGNLVCSGHQAGQILVWDIRIPSSKPSLLLPTGKQMESITALDGHKAQNNLLCFGTENGSIGFVDVRCASELIIPNSFEVASGEITKIKFHPSLGENLFTSSDDGSFVHWDASGAYQYAFGTTPSGTRSSSWFSSSLGNAVRLTSIMSKSSVPVSSFDVCGNSVVIAFSNQMIRTIDGLRLA